MDRDAERLVYNSMVEVTRAQAAPRPGLSQAHEILCVNNGEWLPQKWDLENMMDMIEGYVHRHNRAPNAV